MCDCVNIHIRLKKSDHAVDLKDWEDALEHPGSRHTFQLSTVGQKGGEHLLD